MLFLISLLSFFLPTQFGLHLNYWDSTVYGFKIDYLIPTIYLTDIIVLLIIIFGFKKLKFRLIQYVITALYLGFVIINIFNSSYFVPAFYKWIKITQFILLALIILKTSKFNVFKHFIKPLSYSINIICFLGITQFLNKGSIGGIFYFLGERSLNFSDPNVSPFPYSTFSHPNSFAGFLLVFALLFLQFRKKFDKKYFWFTLILVGLNIVFTNSLNVFSTILILILIKFYKHLNKPVFFVYFLERSVTHRLELISASLKMIKNKLLLGVGLNNFIPNLPKVTNTFLNAWELQPVHNIFLLIFSEAGIIGLFLFCYVLLFNFSIYNYPLIAVVITGLSDHYWITLQQNMLLFTYVLIISYRWKMKK